MGALLLVSQVMAAPLMTMDKTCTLYYTTDKNTAGWSFQIGQGACQNGFAQGRMIITVYDAFHKPIEQIYGFFNRGYWTGEHKLDADIIDASTDGNLEKVSFLIETDDQTGARLIGQMNTPIGTVQPFEICRPFKALIQTRDNYLLNDEQTRDRLMARINLFAQSLCPDLEMIQIYGSMQHNPAPEDVSFFAEADTVRHETRLIKTPVAGDKPIDITVGQIDNMLILSRVMNKPIRVRVQTDLGPATNNQIHVTDHLILTGENLTAGPSDLIMDITADKSKPLTGTARLIQQMKQDQ